MLQLKNCYVFRPLKEGHSPNCATDCQTENSWFCFWFKAITELSPIPLSSRKSATPNHVVVLYQHFNMSDTMWHWLHVEYFAVHQQFRSILHWFLKMHYFCLCQHYLTDWDQQDYPRFCFIIVNFVLEELQGTTLHQQNWCKERK